MTKLSPIILSLILAGCGGGSDAHAPPATTPPTSAPTCTPKVVTVVLLGDSTMVGLELFDGNYRVAPHNPGTQLQADMDARFGPGAVVVTDYGVGGTTAPDGNPVTADVIVANYGINDAARLEPLDTYKAALLALHPTIIETQNPSTGDPGNVSAQPYVDAGKSLGLPVADTNAYVQTVAGWGALLSDGLHPTDALYQLIVDNVLAPAVAVQVAPLRCVK